MTTKGYIKDYPRPQFVRDKWMNLNGEWDFRFDDDNVGEIEKWQEQLAGSHKITVPFTYETQASGIGTPEFHSRVWYSKNVSIPKEAEGKRVILHFQAVDYIAKVWVNGVLAGSHQGAYAAFSFDITPYLIFGEDNIITLKAEDSDDCTQPRGKQRWTKDNFECFYVQTTGIWQTVWLEYVDEQRLDRVKITPDLDHARVAFDYRVHGLETAKGTLRLEAIVTMKDRHVKTVSLVIDRPRQSVEVDLVHEVNGPWKRIFWSPQQPNLYDVEFVLYHDDIVVDRVLSYFGMRKVSIEKGKVLLNNVPIYQRLMLDQGYWTESHLTPPSEEALIADIDYMLEMGYNGVRKHMKVEDARFLYWCDVKGLLVWSEMAATFEFHDDAVENFTKEWLEILHQQYNHPSIITWVPFNESWGIPYILHDQRQQKFTESIYHLTKSYDPYRPVITNDGWEHTVSDIITLHDYVETGEKFLKRYAGNKDAIVNKEITCNQWKYALADGYEYKGQPIMITEFGGIAFQSDKGWGYGHQVQTDEEFLERFDGLVQAIKSVDYICGFCYTQLTDVQQEINGLLTEDRKPKFPLAKIKEINLK
ncbi:glycoside hydrolase family 2 [Paenibacillus sp. Marseille-P2973]|uniref:glycoside hydrolase family 2 protein n=1 Tax=Paenibacillus TaxID=44249 RepID=UPI001B38E8FA|nr:MULTISPECIES: sugar-binding domain-containing protein [Paenibacillus]MBQ4898687.1 glycoside hydrolase family 2 [Paenibacillus sp. Marseille-P2973]MDN4069378.1 glycoside hydrolase family 2 TIM barrel-domain containing protein [Paenibacillus vini]